MEIISNTNRTSGLKQDLKKPAIVEFLLNGNLVKGTFKAFKKNQILSDSKFIHAKDCDTKTPYILDADTIQSITIIRRIK